MKYTLVGLAAALLLSGASAFGTVTINNATTSATADTAANASSGGSSTTLGNITIAEGASTDFAAQTATTLILTAPTGWTFVPGTGAASFQNGRDGSSASVVTTTNTTTVTITVGGTGKSDTLTISGLKVQPNDGLDLTTNTIVRQAGAAGGTSRIVGTTNAAFATVKQIVGAAKQLVIQTQPSSTATAGVAFAQQPVLFVQDQFGTTRNTAHGASDNTTSVTAARTTGVGAGTLQGVLTKTAANGVVTFTNLSHTVATNISITFTAGAGTNVASGNITVNPAPVNKLTFVTSPGSAVAGSAFGIQPSVHTQDSFGNDSVNGLAANLNVTASLTTGTGTLLGTKTLDIGTAAGNGVVTFTDLEIDITGSKQLTAAASGLTSGTSATFTLNPAAAVRLAMQTQPSASATAGVAFAAQPVVRLEDQFGNTVTTNSTAVVSAGIATGSGTLQGTLNGTAVNGLATFSGLNHRVAGPITLSFTSGSLTPTNSTTITINPAAIAKLAFSASPATATAGSVFPSSVIVKTRDAFDNDSTSGLAATRTVTVTLSSGTGPLQGTNSLNIGTSGGNGTATFSNLRIDIAGVNKQLGVASTGLTGASNSVFSVVAASAAKLVVQTQPSTNATAGLAFAQQPVVLVEDSFGNVTLTNNTTVVTAARNSGAGTLQGTTGVTVNGGVATFTDLFHTQANTINLTFTSPGLTNATSGNITVNAAPASQLVFTTQPNGAAVGVTLSTQPVIRSRDQFGNNSTVGLGTSHPVSLALTSGYGPLLGTTTLNIGTSSGNGVISFANLRVDASGQSNRLTATSALGSFDSDYFDVAKGAQTVSFGTLASKVYGDAPFTVSATASSGLAPAFSIVSGPATNLDNLITITGAGTVVVRASQDGDTNWNAAVPVDQSFVVSPAVITVASDNKSRVYAQTNPVLTVSYSGFAYGETTDVISGEPTLSTVGTNTGVGVYPINVSIGTLSALNYSFAFTNGNLTITPAPLVATADNKSRGYGEVNPVFTASYSGFVNDDTTNVLTGTLVGVTPAETNSPIGVYPISVSGVSATNYSISFVDGELTITPFQLVAVAFNATNIYGATNTSFSGSLSGVQNSDDITVTFETTNVTATSTVGTYTIVPFLHDPNGLLTNYSVITTNAVLTVAKATLTATADNQTRIYAATNPVLTVTYTGFMNGETNDVISGAPDVTTTATTNVGVGSYPMVATLGTLSATNYDFTFVDGTMLVTPAPLVGQANNKVRTYGALNPEFTAAYTGFVNDDDTNALVGTLVGSTPAITNSPVGVYPITVSGQTASNYSITYLDGSLTITPAVLSVTADNAGKVYGSANPTYSGTLSGVLNADDITATFDTTGVDATTSVGEYPIVPTLHDPASRLTNYTVFSTNATLTISRATLTVTADDKTRVYGNPDPVFTATYTGFQNTDSSNVVSGVPGFTIVPPANEIGTYAIVPNIGTLSAQNYDFAFANGVFTVTTATLTVKVDNSSRVYGASNPQFTLSYSGLLNGDTTNVVSGTPSFVTAATETSPIGDYPVSVSGLSASNYVVVFQDGTLTVQKSTLTAAGDDVSRTYGATNPIFTGTLTANQDSITATFACAATTNSPVGTYPITPVFDDPNNRLTNYTVQNTGTLTIDKAPLAIAADATLRGYGAMNPSFTGTVSGMQNNEDVTVAFSSETTTNSPVGDYPIHADLFATNTLAVNDPTMLDNYEITTNGLLTITNAPLVVTISNAAKAYGMPNPSFDGALVGIQNGENITPTYITPAVALSPIGSYPITATLSDGGTGVLTNYTVVINDGILTIGGSGIFVSADNASKVYGATNPAFTGTLTGALPDDGITVSYTTIADTNSNIGTYQIVPVLDDHGNGSLTNYVVYSTNGVLTVTKAPLVITANDDGVGAGTNTPPLTAVLNGVQNNDFTPANVICALSPARLKPITIANYSIVVSNIIDPSSKLGNYSVTTNVGIFRVVDKVKISAQPVASPKSTVQQGMRVVMTAKATGIVATYQWRFNDVDIPGATTATNIIATARFSDAGIYTVAVANPAGGIISSNLVLTVLADTNVPTVGITRPGNNSITLNSTNQTGTIIACGSASDSARVTNVFYRLNGSDWTPISTFAPKDANGTSVNWTNQLNAAIGTNTFEVYSADWTGNTSKVSKSVFFFHVPSQLIVDIDEHDTRSGEGSSSIWPPDYRGTKNASLVVAPNALPTNGASLYVNRGPYVLTAIAGHNQIFTNWTKWVNGSPQLASTNAKYTFVMEQDMHVTANFIHNPWMEAQGTYYGLFTNADLDFKISGYITLKVSTNMTFSGKLLVDGDNVSLSGPFNIDGTKTLTISRAKLGKTPLTVNLQSIFAVGDSGTNQIVGTVTDGTLTANIVADQWVYQGASSNSAFGKYTMVLANGVIENGNPIGYGYSLVTVATNANMTVAGALADGTVFTPETATVAKNGRWPVFKQIYAGKLRVINYTNLSQFHTNSVGFGSYIGWLNFSNNTDIGGVLKWTKMTVEPTNIIVSPTGAYTNRWGGFTNELPVTGLSYVQRTNDPTNLRLISVTNALINFADGDLTGTQSQAVQLKTNNAVAIWGYVKVITKQTNIVAGKPVVTSFTNMVLQPTTVGTNAALGKLTVSFDAKTGKMTGSFTNGISLTPTGAAKAITFNGVVLQPWNAAYGFFLGTNQSGSVTLQADSNNP